MVLQKAMKQGRDVHGIPLLDACSDHNITSRMCGHDGGYAYYLVSLLSAAPFLLFIIFSKCFCTCSFYFFKQLIVVRVSCPL